MQALGDRYSCFAPDLPGLGECDEPPPSFDFSRAAAMAFMDGLVSALVPTGPLVLVVHDIGGIVGIPWAAKNVARLRGLVVTNTVVFERFPWFGTARTWARTDALGRLRNAAVMGLLGVAGGRLFRKANARISPELPDADLDRMTREFALDAKSKRSTLRLFRQMVPHEYFSGYGAMVRDLVARVPVHVVWGQGDPYIPARYVEEFPGARLDIVKDGGHWVPISGATRVASAIEAVSRGATGEPRTSA
jgi:pimeloyl-ACP methyl ester carboxylesterase